MAADLKALRDIITTSIDQIIAVCEETGKDFPKLSEPVQFSEFTPDGIRNHPKVADNIGLAVAAAFQLIQTIQPPPATLTIAAFRHSLPVSLGIVERANVAEILRKAGPQGLHVKEIAAKNNIDPKKLSRVLRFLATNHWFTEVAPDVFANNLLSSLLDTGKEITPNFRETKHRDSHGLAAIAGYGADEVIKAMAEWQDVLFDPKTAFSEETNETGMQKALGVNVDQWAYYDYDTPEARYRSERFNIVMSGASKLHPPQAALIGFDWASVPKNGLVVDVGGSRGHVSLEIAKAFPELNIVIEDRAVVVEEAKKYWAENLQSHIDKKKVHFIGTDFFEPQPKLPATPDVFLLRTIIHDWSDKYSVKLLSNLRKAASPNTKLVLIDSLVNYACEAPSEATLLGKDAKVPAPLLPNLGGANVLAYSVDVVLGSCLNSGERTIDNYITIIQASGWKLVEVRKNPGSKIWWPALICVPA